MTDTKKTEGLIPEGMIVANVRGTITDGLAVAGTISEIHNFNIDHLVVAETGKIESGRIEADEVTIKGRVANVEFNAKRLSVEAGAHVKDCDIRMAGVSGFSIDEKAVFDGDVKIAVSGAQSSRPSVQPETALQAEANLAEKDAEKDVVKEESSMGEDNSFANPLVETPRAPENKWDSTPDINEANQPAHIPLGD